MESTRLRLLLDFPFFGSLAMRLPLIADPSVPTFRVNGVDMRYNPTYAATLSKSEKMFSYIQGIMRIVLGHFERKGNRDPDLWNIASAYAVNQLIPEEHGVRHPQGTLINSSYANKSAEEIYAELAGDFEEIARAGGTDPESTDPGDGADPADSDEAGGASELRGDGDHQGADFDGGPDVEDATLEAAYANLLERATQFGDVVDAPTDSEVTAEGMRGAASMVAQLMEADGTYIPTQIKKLIYTITDVRLPWEEFLSQFLHESCMADYNWMIPDTKYLSDCDFILPSLESNDAMTLAVVLDTSGSVNRHYLGKFMSAFFNLVASINYTSVTVLTCSDRVLTENILYPGQQYNNDIAGGNTTKFAPAFTKVAEMPVQPACLVYFTDLASDDFGPAPAYPVMWIGNYTVEWEEAHKKRVPFGQVLSMRE